jgi:tRNA (mo5U34)-methyltransferase
VTRNNDKLHREVAKLNWWHQIDLGDGVITPGSADIGYLNSCADIYFAGGLAGRSFLDIGCWDGFNSLEAVRRGASRVLATDHWVWANVPWASRKNIELVRDSAAPQMEIMDIDLPDLTPERVGTFDFVLFAGVLYHLPNMIAGLEQAAALTNDVLVVETYLDADDIPRPAAIFYPGTELNNDGSNWWGPNQACVEGMLRNAGFAHVQFTRPPFAPTRGIFRAAR